MSENIIFVLMYHRHKLLDQVFFVLYKLPCIHIEPRSAASLSVENNPNTKIIMIFQNFSYK
jgi:hypothetical protein